MLPEVYKDLQGVIDNSIYFETLKQNCLKYTHICYSVYCDYRGGVFLRL